MKSIYRYIQLKKNITIVIKIICSNKFPSNNNRTSIGFLKADFSINSKLPNLNKVSIFFPTFFHFVPSQALSKFGKLTHRVNQLVNDQCSSSNHVCLPSMVCRVCGESTCLTNDTPMTAL